LVKAFFECLFLPVISTLVFLRETFWQYRVRQQFYTYLPFKVMDRALLSFYKNQSAFKISKNFLKSHGEDHIYTYGSTPLHVYHTLLTRWIKDDKGSYCELGSGTGRGLLFLSSFSSCQIEGVEWNPQFVKILQTLQKQLDISNIRVIHHDYKKLRSFCYDWIYLYEFFLTEKDLCELCDLIAKRSTKNTKVISVSFPLSDYHPDFAIFDSFSTRFVWGRAEVFLNKLKDSHN
jgi:hypothetical protein